MKAKLMKKHKKKAFFFLIKVLIIKGIYDIINIMMIVF